MNKFLQTIGALGALCLALLFVSQAHGQSISLERKISLTNRAVTGSIDRAGNIYIADNKGSLFKMDSIGTLLYTYSPDRKGNIEYVEAWETLNILLFYEGLQEYRLLNRFLTQVATHSLSQNIFARLLAPGSDNNIWVFDDRDFALKKFNTGYNTLDIGTDLSGIVEKNFQGAHLREYQHLVFMADYQSGIYVFDNLGNFIKTLPFAKVRYFNFLQNKLYFLSGNEVLFYDLYTGEENIISVPTEQTYELVLATDTRLYFISQKAVDIFLYEVE